jgi:hypothetical protein
MDETNNLMHGFSVAMTLPNPGFMVLGVTLGILIGVLPGLGGGNGIVILLPLTFSMDQTSAIIMLCCIYWRHCSAVRSRRSCSTFRVSHGRWRPPSMATRWPSRAGRAPR